MRAAVELTQSARVFRLHTLRATNGIFRFQTARMSNDAGEILACLTTKKGSRAAPLEKGK